MSWDQLAILGILGTLIVLLLRASYFIGRNPYLRIREAEKLSGPFPSDMSFKEKQRLLDRFGVSRHGFAKSLLYMASTFLGALLIYLLRHWL